MMSCPISVDLKLTCFTRSLDRVSHGLMCWVQLQACLRYSQCPSITISSLCQLDPFTTQCVELRCSQSCLQDVSDPILVTSLHLCDWFCGNCKTVLHTCTPCVQRRRRRDVDRSVLVHGLELKLRGDQQKKYVFGISTLSCYVNIYVIQLCICNTIISMHFKMMLLFNRFDVAKVISILI